MVDLDVDTPHDHVAWADQSRSYGEQYHDVYHHFFPAGPGRSIARALAERAHAIAIGARPCVVELGVGTGRVAHPLVDFGVDVLGIDSSPELLDVARRGASEPSPGHATLELEIADIRSWSPQASVDVVACVCATLSMFATDCEREAALRVARRSLHDGGAVIVETHDPSFVRNLHGRRRELDFDFPTDGLSGVVGRSVLDGSTWSVEFEWRSGGAQRVAAEHSRLLDPSELREIARRVGLRSTGVFETWADLASRRRVDTTTGTQPTYIIEFEPAGEPT